ncbi:hypothetical protein Golob_024561 [Gossypium lobatum]|uniref:Uncharacterized protein n=1 Tax=Gossypium lobatum TaxID=34289 RepID=A0A7J8NI89_9ROSI|nr:hypothetical protein [Gossypium lobatum]
MPYADLRTQECVLAKFLANRNICDVKVPLVIFATVAMQHRRRRLRRWPINPRLRDGDAKGSTSVPSALKDSIAVQPLGHYG